MSIFTFFALFSTLTLAFTQLAPPRLHLAIDQLRRYHHLNLLDLLDDKALFDLTPQNIFKSISYSSVSNQTDQCQKDFQLMILAASQRQQWALKILDAWGKPLPSGILKGNLFWTGNYDECLQELYLANNKSFLAQPFNAQYCG
jgi:hypothetical protein